MKAKLDKGKYIIKLDFFTEFSKKKASSIEEKVHYTFVLANKEVW